MPDKHWTDELSVIEGAVARIDSDAVAVTKADAKDAADRLRTVNAKIWRLVKTFEANATQHFYDVHALLKAMAETKHADISEVWLDLIEHKAITLRPKALLEEAVRYGLNPHDYLEADE